MHCKHILILILITCNSVIAQVNFLTQRGSNDRLGANMNETILNTTNVGVGSFGKLYNYPVDGHVYAQPLYVSGVNIPGKGIRNVLFVATMHNTLYAYDADSLTAPLWQANLGTSCALPDVNIGQGVYYYDIKVEVGIMSTPVIDLDANTIFVVAFTKEDTNYYHRLHAFDIRTGYPKDGSPVTLQGTAKGDGQASVDGTVFFHSNRQIQRTALTLSNGIIYIMFASYGDMDPYHGWILGHGASTLSLKYTFNVTPNGEGGGIWMSGQGASVDEDGCIYIVTGDGDFTAGNGGREYGDSFLKLKPSGDSLKVIDYFTPYNQQYLNINDLDLGVDGPILISNSNLVIGGSKEGKLYVVDKTQMGGFNAISDSQIVQRLDVFKGHLHGSVAYWDGPTGSFIYGWSENDTLRVFQRNNNKFVPFAEGKVRAPTGMPGGIPVISSYGTIAGTGILWVSIPFYGDANHATVKGILRAYDATDVSKEIWTSQQYAGRDAYGYLAKYNSPLVINGKVYQPTFTGQITVYGLNPPQSYLRIPENPVGVVNGLNYLYSKCPIRYWYNDLPLYSALNPVIKDTINTFDISVAKDVNDFVFSYNGYIDIPVDGMYTFYLNSDDGSQLLIGGSIVVNNNGLHTLQEIQDSIGLKAGKHAITVNYSQGIGPSQLVVSYSGPTFSKTIIPDSVLYRLPFLSISPNESSNICIGDSLKLTAPIGNYSSYQWLKDGNNINLPQAKKHAYYVKEAGIYSVIVSNRYSVNDTSVSVSISLIENPISTIGSSNSHICLGDSLKLSARVSMINYRWFNNDTIIPNAKDSILYIRAGGNYKVKIIDNNNCIDTSASVLISVVENPVATIKSSNSHICLGDSLKLSTIASMTNYRWFNNDIIIPNAKDSILYVKEEGEYRVKIIDNNNCIDTSSIISIAIFENPVSTINPSGSKHICLNDSLKLSAKPYMISYQWLSNNNIISNARDSILYVTDDGNYTVKITDTNNCTDISAIITVTVTSLPSVNPIIGNQGTIINSSEVYTVINTNGYSYIWSIVGGNLSITSDTSINVLWNDLVINGLVILKVIDINGCSTITTLGVSMVLSTENEKNMNRTYLGQSYPNPTDAVAAIEFGVNSPGRVFIGLYKPDGTKVMMLYDGYISDKGKTEVNIGNLENGIYLYKMVAENNVLTKFLTIIR